MKKYLLPILLLLLAVNSDVMAIALNISGTNVDRIRWRNDNGDEVNATWSTPMDDTLLITRSDQKFRVRLGYTNRVLSGSGFDLVISGEMNLSENFNAPEVIDGNTNSAFSYISSSNVAHNQATTSQLSNSTTGFVSGKILTQDANNGSETIISANNFTEYEYVMTSNAFTKPMRTYILVPSLDDLAEADVLPIIKTGCLDAFIINSTGNYVCGNSSTQIFAESRPGIIVAWQDSIGNELARGNTFITPIISKDTYFFAVPIRQYDDSLECHGDRVRVDVKYFDKPTVSIGADTVICQGKSVKLTPTPNTFRFYEWSNGSVAQNITVNSAGTYALKVTDFNNCTATDTMQLAINPLPIIDLGNDTAICNGDSIMINADPMGYGYKILWNNGDTINPIYFKDENVYGCTVTDNNRCSNYDEIKLRHKDLPKVDGINAYYVYNNTYNFSMIKPEFYSKVVWNFGDGSPEKEGEFVSHTFPDANLYTITLKLGAVCDSNSFSIFTHRLDALNIDKIEKNAIAIYPNPTKELININSGELNVLALKVYDITGRILITSSVIKSSSVHTLDVSELETGNFIIEIITDGKSYYSKFTKQ